jgi:inhibitor of cysteine peptidase
MKKITLGYLILLVAACHATDGSQTKGKEEEENPPDKPHFGVRDDVERFSSCSEIEDYVGERQAYHDYLGRRASREGSVEDAVYPSDAVSSGPKVTYTNVQEQGIDEGDRVKIDDKFLYAVSPGFINIIRRDTLAITHSLPLAKNASMYPVLYTSASRLTVIEESGGYTNVRIYEVDQSGSPTLSYENRFDGQLRESRLNAGFLVLAINDSPVGISHLDVTVDISIKRDISCTDVVKPFIDDMTWQLTKVISINIEDPEIQHRTAFLGNIEHLYMSDSSIYVTQSGYPMYSDSYEPSTIIARIAFDPTSGLVVPQSAGMLPGYVIGQWAFKEYAEEGVVSVATTANESNNLWIMEESDGKLRDVASIRDFAPREDIRAVRYVGTMGYVVTFEKTDPLFAFDLSNPREPKLVSELKIPGFSMYLHPLSETELLGIGYEGDDQGDFSWFQGIQVSLFNVADATNMSRTDVAVLGKRGSYSDVTGDHKAFMFDKESGLVSFPVNTYDGVEGGGPMQGPNLTFSGAIIYRPENGTLNEVGRVSHSDLIDRECLGSENYHWWQDVRRSLDINRIFSIDGRLLTFSRYGLKAFSLDLIPQKTVKFPTSESDCSTYGWWLYTPAYCGN